MNSDYALIAANCIERGGVISFGTDTVYGIAADATNEQAVEKIFRLKGRDHQKPIAVLVKDLAAAKKFFEFDKVALELASKYMPGALTLVLKKKIKLAKNLNPNDDYLGFRIINTKFISDLLSHLETSALALTSANPHSKPPATTAGEVVKYFGKNLDLVIDTGTCEKKIASTVAKVANGKIEIIRLGAIEL